MHGLNVIARPTPDDQTDLEIAKIYHSIQGEGPFAGEPAVFVCLAGCNLQCKFCDTDFETVEMSVPATHVVALVERERLRAGPCGLVVLTGGEPLRQDIGPLVRALNARGWRVQVETAGTLWRPHWVSLFAVRIPGGHVPTDVNTIVCSPKTTRLTAGIHHYIHALKYIVQHGQMCVRDGFPVTSTQMRGPKELRPLRPAQLIGTPIHPTQIYMLPCDTDNKSDNAKNLIAATMICKRKGYRLAVRINKIARVP